MPTRRLFALLLSLTAALAASPTGPPSGPAAGRLRLQSMSKLAFAPDGTLFLGDSYGARIFAFHLDDRQPAAAAGALRVRDLEGKIAAMLGADPRDVLIHDLAVNPVSKNAYLTVSRGRRGFVSQWQLPNDVAAPGVLLRVSPQGEIREVRLEKLAYSSVAVANPVSETAESDDKSSKLRVDAISDMVFADGKLYVAGLSNEEFSSTMRVYPFPFAGPAGATSLEIYHGSHGRYETNSPVRAFLPLRIGHEPYLLASYVCTPLVLFRLDELQHAKHVKGKTIAELGDGDYPLDMVAFKLRGEDLVMLVTSARGVVLIKAAELSQPLPAITAPVHGTAGLRVEYLRNPGILKAERYGDDHLLLLARNLFNGEVTLSAAPLDDLQ
jgi:hypothetical protein